MTTPDLADGIKWYVAFVFSTTLHEAAHAWTAWRLGDDTAHRGGQVTLDPTPHIKREPFGMVVVPILSYLLGGWMIGWASAPYDPAWAQRHPQRSAWMSLAGPASNFLLVLLCAIGIRIGIATGAFVEPLQVSFSSITDPATGGFAVAFAKMLSIGFSLNLLLCCFNLLPLPPLDGGSLLLLFTRGSWSQRVLDFIQNPQLQFFGIFVAWKIFGPIFRPIQLFAINLLYPGLHYG